MTIEEQVGENDMQETKSGSENEAEAQEISNEQSIPRRSCRTTAGEPTTKICG